MLNLLVRYKILTNRGGGIVVGNYINVYWDDSAEDIEVQQFDDGSDTSGTVITTGPDLGARDVDHSVISGLVIDILGFSTNFTEYRFCDGTTLKGFFTQSTFPYVAQYTSSGHASCTVSVVCDLQISDDYTVVNATDTDTNDGSIEVTATSSNGTIKYAVDQIDFDYATQGQTSGLFEDLFSGSHTVTAKDASGCVDTVTIVVNVPDFYNPLYRLEYTDRNGSETKVDILERGFEGDVTEVKGYGNSPFILRYNADGNLNKFKSIIPSEARLSLVSETNFQFIDLFSQDDRKYQLKYYKDDVLKWVGYLLSDNYSEAYIAPPYAVDIVATDGLADLKSYDFVDPSGNRYRDNITPLKAISDILKKTDLGINIQAGINRYEVDMDQTDSDDPLNQCTFDPTTFYDTNSTRDAKEVLEEILKPFGGRLLQRNAKWFITSVEEMVTSMDYREFDSSGTYVSEGSIDDSVNIDVPIVSLRAAFRDRAQVLETIPAYGVMNFQHNLIKNVSLVTSYGFEEDDTYTDPQGLTKFKDWNVNISNAPGVNVGIKETKSLQGEWNLYVTYPIGIADGTSTPLGKYVIITQKTFQIEYDGTDLFEFSFDYVVLLNSLATYLTPPAWVKIKWKFKVGSYFFIDGIGWDASPDNEYNNVCVTSFESDGNFRIRGNFRNISEPVTEDVILEFVIENSGTRDFNVGSGGSAYDDLKALPTDDLPLGFKVKGYKSGTGSTAGYYYYILQYGSDSESLPDKVRPNDYNAVTNIRYWLLEDTRLFQEQPQRPTEFVYLDNVILLHYPKGAEPPKSITIERTNNTNIKLDFDEEYLLNDIDTTTINNSERTYKNFFRLLDGTPTQTWERTYRDGQGSLLELLSSDFVSQYKNRTAKLTGSFISDTEVLPSSCMVEVNNDNKKYIFMGYELDDKNYSITFDMLELVDVITDDETPEIDAGFTVGFSLGFRS